MKTLSRSYLWWPRLDKDQEAVAKSCLSSQSVKQAPAAAPFHSLLWPTKPWQCVKWIFLDHSRAKRSRLPLTCIWNSQKLRTCRPQLLLTPWWWCRSGSQHMVCQSNLNWTMGLNSDQQILSSSWKETVQSIFAVHLCISHWTVQWSVLWKQWRKCSSLLKGVEEPYNSNCKLFYSHIELFLIQQQGCCHALYILAAVYILAWIC